MRAWVFALALPACGFASSAGSDAGGAPPPPREIDAALAADATPAPAIDAAVVDGSPDQVCVGTFVKLCVDPGPAPLTLGTQRIDTSSSQLCATYHATPAIDACVLVGSTITVTGTVTVVGGRPLILVSTGDLTVAGTLDAGSHEDRTGPAADTGPCATDFMNPPTNRSGGGWGASFGGPGGNGGSSSSGDGGTAPSAVTISALTGGCPGGKGANNGVGLHGGDGGKSGGAILLAAAQTIAIDGQVNASGQGGNPGNGGLPTGGGAGGGGSGGMIVLDAASVQVTGTCFANGGGGGEGGNSIPGHVGSESTAPNSVGAGGSGGNSTGGTGGASAFGNTNASSGLNGANGKQPSPANGGGGAGGGGAGVIKVFASIQDGTDDKLHVAPPPR